MHPRFALSAMAVAVSIASLPQPCAAQPAERLTFATVVADNDWFGHQDRHYTTGSHLAFVKGVDTLPEFARGFAPLRWSADRLVTLAIGQRLYTPGNLNPKPEEPPDRPF